MEQLLGILAGGCAEPRLLSQGPDVSEAMPPLPSSPAPLQFQVHVGGCLLRGKGCLRPGKVVCVSFFLF